jgi:hypothetical protein
MEQQIISQLSNLLDKLDSKINDISLRLATIEKKMANVEIVTMMEPVGIIITNSVLFYKDSGNIHVVSLSKY